MKVKYEGNILQVLETTFTIPGTNKTKTFEAMRRAPGVRALIVKNGKILLSHEYRHDLQKFDYRLPGGKVFDSLNDYKQHLASDMLPFATQAVIKECKEEIGFEITKPKLFYHSVLGSSIVWDLYYFEIKSFKAAKQHLEEGEIVDKIVWKSFEEIKQMAITGEINEDRSLAVILKYILKQEK